MLSSVGAEVREICKQIGECSNSCKKRKMERESAFHEIESTMLDWYHIIWALGIPIDGNFVCEKAKKITDRMHVDCFPVSDG